MTSADPTTKSVGEAGGSRLRGLVHEALPDTRAWVALVYLAAAFGLGRLGLPELGFAAVAVAAAVYGAWILLRHRPNPLVLWLGVVVAVAMAVPQVLGIIRGFPVSTGQLAFAIAVGVAVWAASLLPPATVRWSVLVALAAVVWAGLGAGLLAVAGIFDYGLYDIPEQNRQLFGLIQLRGVMPHPNTMGIFAGLAFVLAARQAITDYADGVRRPLRYAGLLLLIAAPAAVAILWSQSRTSAIAAACGFVVALLPLNRSGWQWLAPVVATVAALMVTVPVIVAETLGYSFNGRSIPWFLAQEEFERSPVVGYGPQFLSEEYRAPLNLAWQPETAHNMLMQAIGEAGIIGLLAVAALILVMCLIAVQAVPYDRQWALIVVVTFCMLAGQESSLSLPVRSALVAQMAVIAASAVLVNRRVQLRSTA